MTLDPRSEAVIATLTPKSQVAARAFLVAANALLKDHGCEARAISGTRSYAEQNALYAKGRTAPGSVVTNAKGGYSNHNFGIAFDIGIFKAGKYLGDSPLYKTVGKLAPSCGLEWGGSWKSFKDYPHYQLAIRLSLAQLRDMVARGESIA